MLALHAQSILLDHKCQYTFFCKKIIYYHFKHLFNVFKNFNMFLQVRITACILLDINEIQTTLPKVII